MNITPRRAAAVSVLSNSLLVGAKVVVGLVTGSVSVLSEAVHSGMDLVASVIAFFSVSASARPPDENHPYGHGKVENVSGVVEALLIVAAAVWIMIEAWHRLVHGGKIESLGLGMVVMGASAAMNVVVSILLFRTARKFDSIALEADAHHLSTDVYTSLGVFAGLLLVRLTGWHELDAIVAILVAVLIGWLGFEVMRRSFVDLVDRRLSSQVEKRIREIIEDHRDHYVEYHQMRTRKAGAEKHIDLHLVVCRFASLQRAHDLCDHIEKDLMDGIERIFVVTHLEPCELPDVACTDCKSRIADGVAW